MATIKVEVTYDPKKETLSQALASLLTEKPEHTEITAQMSLFDNPAPTETPTAQTSTEAPQESPAESASEAPDTKPTEEKTISKADVRALAVKLSKNDKAALKAIFKELGVANLSAVKEEDYPVFYEKLVGCEWLNMLSYPPAARIGGSCVRRAPSSSRSSPHQPALTPKRERLRTLSQSLQRATSSVSLTRSPMKIRSNPSSSRTAITMRKCVSARSPMRSS